MDESGNEDYDEKRQHLEGLPESTIGFSGNPSTILKEIGAMKKKCKCLGGIYKLSRRMWGKLARRIIVNALLDNILIGSRR